MKKDNPSSNSPKYENHQALQKQELKRVLNILKDIIWDMDLPWIPKHVKVGRPPHKPHGLVLLTILQKFVDMTDRDFESFLLKNQWILKELGLDKEISRSSFYLARTKVTKDYLTLVNAHLLKFISEKVSEKDVICAKDFKDSRKNSS
ncbi:MAG: hypothetical protein ACFFCD_04135 [Promethearchaeota archaeon]